MLCVLVADAGELALPGGSRRRGGPRTRRLLTVDGADDEVRGPGMGIVGVVGVYGKDDLGHGMDIRVWSVRRHSDGDLFAAEHAP